MCAFESHGGENGSALLHGEGFVHLLLCSLFIVRLHLGLVSVFLMEIQVVTTLTARNVLVCEPSYVVHVYSFLLEM